MFQRFSTAARATGLCLRRMLSSYRSHVERTAEQPRDKALYTAQITEVSRTTPNLRLFTLMLSNPSSSLNFTFKPGQWLDVYVPSPSAPSPGGFTVLSSPSLLPRIKLAIQAAPQNPPAAWLFQDELIIVGKELKVRVGGSFTFPPSDQEVSVEDLQHVVFVGAGVGINPLLSMLQHINENPPNKYLKISFLYSTKPPIPEPYMSILSTLSDKDLKLFITADTKIKQSYYPRRMTVADVKPEIERYTGDKTLMYICGPPGFTDELISSTIAQTKLPRNRILVEKWW